MSVYWTVAEIKGRQAIRCHCLEIGYVFETRVTLICLTRTAKRDFAYWVVLVIELNRLSYAYESGWMSERKTDCKHCPEFTDTVGYRSPLQLKGCTMWRFVFRTWDREWLESSAQQWCPNCQTMVAKLPFKTFIFMETIADIWPSSLHNHIQESLVLRSFRCKFWCFSIECQWYWMFILKICIVFLLINTLVNNTGKL